MNRNTLKNIAQGSEPLDAGSVQDLIELTKRFPYFAWPYAILARHYQQKQDFRAEALMHQAAMRIHSRTWLYGFTHLAARKPSAHISEENLKSETTETPLSHSVELPLLPDFPQSETANQETKSETVAEIPETQKESQPEVSLIQESETTKSEPILDSGSILEALNSNEKTETPLKTSDTTDIKKTASTPVALHTNTLKDAIGITKSARFKTIDPPAEKNSNSPKPSSKGLRPEFMAYDLERLYSQNETPQEPVITGTASNDFYAWLNSSQNEHPTPLFAPNSKETKDELPKSIENQKSIIENFLLTKPSISRPKQEFFKPEKAQKKGEVLSGKIVTETLAQIYLKQDNPEKAIWAYEQLQLKFPEKKTYFANLITEIKKEQNKS